MYFADDWRGEFTFFVVAEARNKIPPNFALLTTLYEIEWEFLHVFYDESQGIPGLCVLCADVLVKFQEIL